MIINLILISSCRLFLPLFLCIIFWSYRFTEPLFLLSHFVMKVCTSSCKTCSDIGSSGGFFFFYTKPFYQSAISSIYFLKTAWGLFPALLHTPSLFVLSVCYEVSVVMNEERRRRQVWMLLRFARLNSFLHTRHKQSIRTVCSFQDWGVITNIFYNST